MKTILGTVMIVALVATVGDAYSGTLGTRYVGVTAVRMTPRHTGESVVSFGGELHFPISGNLDGDVTAARTFSEDGMVGLGTSAVGILQFQLLPGATFNPFISTGVLWANSEIQEETDWGTGCVLGGGAEITVNQTASITAVGSYQLQEFGEDDTTIGIGFDALTAGWVLVSLTGSYSLDSGVKGLAAGVAVEF